MRLRGRKGVSISTDVLAKTDLEIKDRDACRGLELSDSTVVLSM